jgi:hypothetical protein
MKLPQEPSDSPPQIVVDCQGADTWAVMEAAAVKFMEEVRKMYLQTPASSQAVLDFTITPAGIVKLSGKFYSKVYLEKEYKARG